MSSINILQVSSARSWRGGENQLAHLLLGLKARGEDVNASVLCQQKTPVHKFCEQHKISVSTYQSKGFLLISFAKKIAESCKQKNIQIVHLHDSHSHTAFLIAKILFSCSAKAILHRRVNFQNKSLLSKWKYNHSSIKKIIVVSDAIGQTLSKILTKPNQNKIIRIYDSLNIEKIQLTLKKDIRKERSLPADSILVGNISALSPEKDYQTFFAVAKNVLKKQTNIHFIILGEGEQQAELNEIVNKSETLKNNVHFLGFQKDAIAYLKDFSVFLMTSKEEGLGTSVLEAFACKIPVVSTDAGGLKEIVKNEETGLLCPVADHKALTDAVEFILLNKKQKEELVENAFSFVKKNFNQEKMVEETIRCYKNTIK